MYVKRNTKGFTLVELIVVVVILGIIAALAVPTFRTVQYNALKGTLMIDAQQVVRNAKLIAATQGTDTLTNAHLLTSAQETNLAYHSGQYLTVIKSSGSWTICASINPNPEFISEAWDCSAFFPNGVNPANSGGSGGNNNNNNDNNNNEGENQDTPAPDLPYIYAVDVISSETELSIALTANWQGVNNTSSYEIRSNGVTLGSWNAPATSGTLNITGLPDGTYDIQIRAQLSDNSYTAETGTGVYVFTITDGQLYTAPPAE